MVTIERNNDHRDGFCKYCGKTGLHPTATICGDDDCEPSDHVYKECAEPGCRNLLGPVSPESTDRYCKHHPS